MEKRDKTLLIVVCIFLLITYGIVFSRGLLGKSVSEDEYVAVIVELANGKHLYDELEARGVGKEEWFRASRKYSADVKIQKKIKSTIFMKPK